MEGYGEAIVLSEINADHFEIKTNLLQLVQANPFYGRESENPHAHINSFKRIIPRPLRFRECALRMMDATPSKMDERIDKLADQLSTLVEIISKKVVTPAPDKTVKESCVTCGGAHSWYNCPTTDNNQASVCATTGTYNQVNPPNRTSNQMAPLGFAPMETNGHNRFNNQVQGNNFNRGNNFHGNQGFQAQNNHTPNFQNQGFQNQPFQVPNNQVQQEISNDFSSYKRNNDQMLRNMQNQINSLKGDLKNEIQNTIKSSVVNIGLGGRYITDISLIGGQPIRFSSLNFGWKRNRERQRNKEQTKFQGVPLNPTIAVLSHFHSRTDEALLFKPKFSPTIKSLLMNKEKLLELAKIPLNENCSAMLLKKLPEKLGDPGKFLIQYQTTRYSSTNDKSVNRIDIIDAVCEEYAPELLGFSNSSGDNPTSTSEPFTSEFILDEIEAYLKDDSISQEIDHADCDPEEDICLIEKLLNNDMFQLPLMDLKQSKVTEAKSSIKEPPELDLKDLPSHLEYAFLEENDKLPVIIAKGLKNNEKDALLKVLKSHKHAIAWKITDMKGIDPRFCTHKILMEDDYKPTVQSQRRVNPKIREVIKNEVLKLLDTGMIYPISDSPWVSPVHCVPMKGGITVVANEENELIPTRLVTGWRVCIDYRKLNEGTRKDHFPLPFMDQMLERLAGNEFYCFLDGFSGYFQIPIDPQDQEKTTFICPYRTFAYRRMPFGLCNAPGTFQRCMMAIFHDMIEKTMEVFMDDFSVFGDSFDSCLSNLEKMLKWCEDTNLVLNWEKCHFMCREGIVLGHKISKSGIEVDRAKVDVIAKLPHPTTVKGVRSFLGHAGFYRRFIQDFSKIARPMTHLLEKETPFVFSKDCIDAFQTLKKKLTEAP
ncbi:reverse transcriptase domain-containing protein [Tanacetum coccineum]|uniref:Reverse transcriptase domain-containing protein n=1 Tax=Tanacetum coccineum TaxID=301880 RepID=A0ABQ5IU02_9ASTR